MTEFRDYSTYLQRIVRLEKQAHDQCSEKKYRDAAITVKSIVIEARALEDWLRNHYDLQQ